MLRAAIPLLLALFSLPWVVGCGDDVSHGAAGGGGGGSAEGGGNPGAGGGAPGVAPEFDLDGALAYALGGEDDRRLFKITASGVETAVDEEVQSFLPLRDGGVVVKVDGGQFILRPDGEAIAIDDGDYAVGETSNGDIYMGEHVWEASTGEVRELSSPLGDQFAVSYLTRDVARVRIYSGDNQIEQVLDTANDRSFTIDGCNNGSVVALSDALVHVDDCGDTTLLDLATGERSEGGIASMNGEQIAVGDGAVFLSSSCPYEGGAGDYGLCHVDGTGSVTSLATEGLAPPNQACCGDRNQALASDGENTVVAVTDGVLAFRRSTGRTGVEIARGTTVVQLSMGAGGVAYYVGGTGSSPVLGTIDVVGGVDTTIDSSRKYAEVRAVPSGP